MGHIGEENILRFCHLIYRPKRFLHKFHAGEFLSLCVINILKAKNDRILLQRLIIEHLHMDPSVFLIKNPFEISPEITDSFFRQFHHIIAGKGCPKLLVCIVLHDLSERIQQIIIASLLRQVFSDII